MSTYYLLSNTERFSLGNQLKKNNKWLVCEEAPSYFTTLTNYKEVAQLRIFLIAK